MINKKENPSTPIILAYILLLFSVLFNLKILFFISLLLFIISTISNKINHKISFVWSKFANFISVINTKILLFLVYFFILTPISLIYRLCNKNSMNRKINDIKSYFFLRNHKYQPSDFEDPW